MTELQEIVKIIVFETGMTVTDIAKEVSFSREHFTRKVSAGTDPVVLSSLKEKFKTPIAEFRARYAGPNTPKESVTQKSPASTGSALAKTVAEIQSMHAVLREFVIERVVARDNVSRERVLAEMGRVQVRLLKESRKKGTPTD